MKEYCNYSRTLKAYRYFRMSQYGARFEVTKEELEKAYSKKTKELLVMDCVYLKEERNSEREINYKLRTELNDLKNQELQNRRAVACLKDAVNKLLGAIP